MATHPRRNPHHVAIIMDGNGRWANTKDLTRSDGHKAGASNIQRVVNKFKKCGVRYVTLYAFSTENWARPNDEVDTIMNLVITTVENQLPNLNDSNIKIVHIGDKISLDNNVRKSIELCEELTASNTDMVLCFAFNYGGRAELINAMKIMLKDPKIDLDLTEAVIEKYLYTHGIPDPDLIIRTAGEMRISNFLIWQSAYSEYYYTDTLWPDFDEQEIDLALQEYNLRNRKYGNVFE